MCVQYVILQTVRLLKSYTIKYETVARRVTRRKCSCSFGHAATGNANFENFFKVKILLL